MYPYRLKMSCQCFFGVYFIATTRSLNNKNLFHLKDLNFMTYVLQRFKKYKNVKINLLHLTYIHLFII